jgi:hypothetical protein
MHKSAVSKATKGNRVVSGQLEAKEVQLERE